MKKIVSLFAIICFLIIYIPNTLAANVTAFEDDFSGGTEQWSSLGYAYPSVVFGTALDDGNSVGQIHAQKVSGQGVRINSVTSGSLEVNDYEFSGRMKIGAGNEYVYILFRAVNDKNFYGIWYNSYYNNICLVKSSYVSSVSGTSVSVASAGIAVDMWFKFRVAVKGNSIDFYVGSKAEPVIHYVDTENPILEGGVGFGVYTGQPGEKSIYFDDVAVTYDDGATVEYIGGQKASSDISGTQYEKAVTLLKNLGIMSDYSEDRFSGEAFVTRGEMADIAAKMLNFKELSPVKNNPASDVLKSHKYAPQIKLVIDRGIMSTEEEFRPDDAVLFEEAAAVCVRLLGYQLTVDYKGGYSNGYIAIAGEKGILNGVESQSGYVITRVNLANMLYNTLKSPVMDMSGSDDSIEYTESSDDTILSMYHNVYFDKGVISAAEHKALKRQSGCAAGAVVINGTEYSTALSGAEKYFGYCVEYYYYNDADSLYIVSAVPYKTQTLTIKAEDIDSFADNVYYYNNGKTQKSVSLSVFDTDVIYNGKPMEGRKYVPDNGYVTLIDNNSDGVYDVADIHDYTTVIVNNIDTINYIITDKRDIKNNIYLKPDNSEIDYKIVNTAGKEIKLGRLTANSVLSAALSEDKMLAEIIVSTDKAYGVLSGFNSDEDTLSIDGKAYDTADDLEELDSRIGKNVVCYLDYTGKVVYTELSGSSENVFAYIIKCYEDSDDENLKVKMFSASLNSIGFYPLAEKITIDGELIKDKQLIIKNMSTGVCAVKFNGYGEINNVDYPYTLAPGKNESVDSLRYLAGDSSSKTRYKSWNQFYNYFTVSNSTVLMEIPLDEGQESLYGTRNISGRFRNDETYYVVGYSMKEDSYQADLLVNYISAKGTTTDPMVVKEKVTAVNEDNEPTEKITFLRSDGTEITYLVTTDYMTDELRAEIDNLEFGDIARVSLTNMNEIVDVVVLIYDCSEKTGTGIGTEIDLNYQWRSCRGNIYSTQGSTIVINRDAPAEGKPVNMDVSVSSGGVYIVDVDKKEIRTADLGEFNTFKLYGQAATPVVLVQYALQNRLLVGYDY